MTFMKRLTFIDEFVSDSWCTTVTGHEVTDEGSLMVGCGFSQMGSGSR